jgi:ketosteroid isomerase-like protein
MSMRGDGSRATATAFPAGGRKRREAWTDQSPHAAPADAGPRADPPQRVSAPKEEVVARLFEAFSRRDLPSVLGLMHPEVVFEPMTATVTRAGEPYRGHEGIRRYAEDVESHWEELAVHLAQIRSAGQAVVALGVVSGRGPGGSFEGAPTTWVVKFREGLVVHAQIFSDERNVQEALVVEQH